MRVSELRRREAFDEVLIATLGALFDQAFRTKHVVAVRRFVGAQKWPLYAPFSMYGSNRPSRRARQYLADSLRHTTSRLRAVPQYVLGTGLSTLPGLRLAARPGFWVAPALPNAAERLLLPGNQRIRAFDFARGVVRVQLKRGFESGGLIREIDARCGDGPAGELGVLDFDREAGWFEERIVDGWCLARCPPWLPRADFAEQAFAKLDRWRERYEREVDAGDWAARGVAEASTIADGLSRAYGPEFGRRFRSAAAVLRSLVDSRTCVRVGPTHGDFQSGNVLIERGTGRVFVCDWEHVGERLWCYDRMVWQTQSRAGGDLSARWLREIDSVGRGGRTVLALFVLEELSFFGRQGLAGPFVAAPEELVTVVEHAVTFARRLT